MSKITLLIVMAIILAFALPAAAEVCVQSDGQAGVFNGTTTDDAGCITPAEYEQMWSIENLVQVGVFEAVVLNDDGTATGVLASSGIAVVVQVDPLSRPVAATPSLEPDAPTIGQVLYGLAWTRQVTGGGVQAQ